MANELDIAFEAGFKKEAQKREYESPRFTPNQALAHFAGIGGAGAGGALLGDKAIRNIDVDSVGSIGRRAGSSLGNLIHGSLAPLTADSLPWRAGKAGRGVGRGLAKVLKQVPGGPLGALAGGVGAGYIGDKYIADESGYYRGDESE